MDQACVPEGSGEAGRVPGPPLFVVGVDGSRSGRAALAEAVRAAASADARILCVHVRTAPGMGELAALVAPGAALIGQDCRDLVEMQAWLDCVQILDPAAVPWEFQAMSGHPARCLREVALARRGAALFVGRSGRRSGWWRWFHRCPARSLAKVPGCPVRFAAVR